MKTKSICIIYDGLATWHRVTESVFTLMLKLNKLGLISVRYYTGMERI